MDSRERVEQLDAALVELDGAGKGWREYARWPKEDRGSILLPSATDQQLRALEESWGHALPPSYRSFLEVCGGWIHFWGDYTLVGVGGASVQKWTEEINENLEEHKEDLESSLGSLSEASIDEWEKEEEGNLYLPRCLVVGADVSGAMWVYDPRTRREDGEMRLTMWDISYGAQDPSFQTFDDFLDWALKETRARTAMEFGGDDEDDDDDD